MKKYQIVMKTAAGQNAGSKAPNDVVKIAEKLNFEKLFVNVRRNESALDKVKQQIEYKSNWKNIYSKIESNSILLLQVPIYVHQLSRIHFLKKIKFQKKVKLIFVVHDVEELRVAFNNNFQKKQFEDMLKLADVIVVHNEVMANFFEKKGFPEEKIVNLKIFDYLYNFDPNKKVIFSKKVIIAGNLDEKKTEYLKKIDKIDAKFDLYGPNYVKKDSNKITYKGVVPANDLPNLLDSGFGLIWDGNSIETCSGYFGNYLKYNNPHKLSLYLTAGLPVFIWSKAAEAKFVDENHLGYTIDSLSDIPLILEKLTLADYNRLIENVRLVGEKISRGDFMTVALTDAINNIKEIN